MKWERGITALVLTLVLLLVIRCGLYIPRVKREILPVFIDITQPFYPVYFGTPEGDRLLPEFRQGQGTIEDRLASLLEGPKLEDLVAVIPPEVRVLGYSQRGDILFVNFSHHLITNHPGGSAGEIITVYGIVNTLVGASGIKRVQILVENEQIDTLTGHLDLQQPLTKDYELLGSSFI